MSGYITLGSRRNGIVDIQLVDSQSLIHIFNPLVFDGDILAWEHIINSDQTQRPPFEQSLAPRDYGLVLFDFDQKVVYDMQVARRIDALLFNRHSYIPNAYIAELAQRGWLNGEFHAYAGGPDRESNKVPFTDSDGTKLTIPPSSLKSATEVQQWVNWVTNAASSKHDLAYMDYTPTGWSIKTFRPESASDLCAQLQASDFQTEKATWDAWEKEMLRTPACPSSAPDTTEPAKQPRRAKMR